MRISEEDKIKLEKLPAIMRVAFNFLLDMLNQIVDGKCDENSVANTLITLQDNSKGKYGEDDLLNYEESMKILRFSNNRVGFKKLMDANNISQVTLGNMKVGFPRTKIMALRARLDDELSNKNK